MDKKLTPNPLSWEERGLPEGKNEYFCSWPGAICARRPVGAYCNTPLPAAKKYTFFHFALRNLRKVSYQTIQQYVGQIAPLFPREGQRSRRRSGVSLTTIAIVWFLSLQLCQAQDFVKLFAEDQKGNVDSVTFGFDDIRATLGIDSALGEKNIYGQPWDSLDIRVIQRDSANHHCIRESFYYWNAPRLYFPENLDSKIDFRKSASVPFTSLNSNFEIVIKAQHYPVKISGYINDNIWDYTGLFLLDSACRNIEFWGLGRTLSLLSTLSDSSTTTIICNFQHEVSIENLLQTPNWNIFPNPASTKIFIKNNQPFDGNIEIISSEGKMINLISMKKEKRQEIDISRLPDGIYFLKYTERKSGKYSLQKLLIQN